MRRKSRSHRFSASVSWSGADLSHRYWATWSRTDTQNGLPIGMIRWPPSSRARPLVNMSNLPVWRARQLLRHQVAPSPRAPHQCRGHGVVPRHAWRSSALRRQARAMPWRSLSVTENRREFVRLADQRGANVPEWWCRHNELGPERTGGRDRSPAHRCRDKTIGC
jgi:hypothetical protein